MKALWYSDLRAHAMNPDQLQVLLDTILDYRATQDVKALFLSGNISNSVRIIDDLELLATTGLEIFFTLGNEDFYGSDWLSVKRKLASKYCDPKGMIHYLSHNTHNFMLKDGVYITGNDGIADLLAGVIPGNACVGFDTWYIDDLKYAHNLAGESEVRRKIFDYCVSQTFTLAKDIDTILINNPSKIVILTNVPPFTEALEGMDIVSMAFKCNQNLGDMLHIKALNNPNVKFEVYCGSVGESRSIDKLENLKVITGVFEGISGEVEI